MLIELSGIRVVELLPRPPQELCAELVGRLYRPMKGCRIEAEYSVEKNRHRERRTLIDRGKVDLVGSNHLDLQVREPAFEGERRDQTSDPSAENDYATDDVVISIASDLFAT